MLVMVASDLGRGMSSSRTMSGKRNRSWLYSRRSRRRSRGSRSRSGGRR